MCRLRYFKFCQTITLSTVFGYVFKATCFVGFALQLTSILKLYLSYKTITEIQQNVPENVEIPGMSICIRYVDIIDYVGLRENTGKSFRFKGVHDSNYTNDLYWQVQESLTVDNILSYTPNVSDLLSMCYMRSPIDYSITLNSARACAKLFKISKYFSTEYVCYQFTQRKEREIKFKFTSNSLLWPGLIYVLQLNKSSLEAALRMKIVVHGNLLPWKSIMLAQSFDRDYKQTEKRYDNYQITVSYRTIEYQLLPPPYASMCRDYSVDGLGSQFDCEQMSLQPKLIQEFQKVPFSGIITQASDYRHVSPYDLHNSTFMSTLVIFERICSNQCLHIDTQNIP